MSSPLTSTQRNLLYVGVALNAFAVFKHTQIGFSQAFPRLNAALGPGSATAFTARMIYLMLSTWWVGTGKLPLFTRRAEYTKSVRNPVAVIFV
jgi:hypothetical protein